jgi:hypothetical protein
MGADIVDADMEDPAALVVDAASAFGTVTDIPFGGAAAGPVF